LGTLLARVFECFVICGYLFWVDKKVVYRIRSLRMSCKSLLREYISVSISVFVSDGLMALGNTVVAMIMGQIGTNFVSANSITFVTQQLSTVMIQGVSHAGCIVTGHTLGRGEKEKTQQQAWTFLALGAVMGAVGRLVILAISEPVISLYHISDETRELARQLMHAIALIVVFQATNSIMMKGMPAFWIYFFLKIDQVLKAFWCVLRLRSGKWIKNISGSRA